ncbi:pyridoxamine 5'-phosphate oxidase family protein [candidate division KSB1 bacterium]|nr:pyridoxamine 5'-phosphate oxidase family protein [candidate division KSB1 bacterium]
MRKKEHEIKSIKEIETIIEQAEICRLALCDFNMPYIVPLCYGYKDKTLYFHCALEGKKIDILKKNNNVCFEIEADVEINKSETPCNWAVQYKSVIGFGKAYLITNVHEKTAALDILMSHYTDGKFHYLPKSVNHALIIKVVIENMTGKRSG